MVASERRRGLEVFGKMLVSVRGSKVNFGLAVLKEVFFLSVLAQVQHGSCAGTPLPCQLCKEAWDPLWVWWPSFCRC